VLAVSAGERTQHEGGKITACGPANIKVLWLTPAEGYWLSGDLGKRAVAVEVPRREAEAARPVPRLRRGGWRRPFHWIAA
jgi:hypothetical protein